MFIKKMNDSNMFELKISNSLSKKSGSIFHFGKYSTCSVTSTLKLEIIKSLICIIWRVLKTCLRHLVKDRFGTTKFKKSNDKSWLKRSFQRRNHKVMFELKTMISLISQQIWTRVKKIELFENLKRLNERIQERLIDINKNLSMSQFLLNQILQKKNQRDDRKIHIWSLIPQIKDSQVTSL